MAFPFKKATRQRAEKSGIWWHVLHTDYYSADEADVAATVDEDAVAAAADDADVAAADEEAVDVDVTDSLPEPDVTDSLPEAEDDVLTVLTV